MDFVNFFKDSFESIPDYRMIVLILFLIKNDKDILKECWLLKSDINRICLEFKNILIEQNEEYLDYIKNEEESIIERILNKQMENDINRLSLEYKKNLKTILLI